MLGRWVLKICRLKWVLLIDCPNKHDIISKFYYVPPRENNHPLHYICVPFTLPRRRESLRCFARRSHCKRIASPLLCPGCSSWDIGEWRAGRERWARGIRLLRRLTECLSLCLDPPRFTSLQAVWTGRMRITAHRFASLSAVWMGHKKLLKWCDVVPLAETLPHLGGPHPTHSLLPTIQGPLSPKSPHHMESLVQ